jgi:hypothetical protein
MTLMLSGRKKFCMVCYRAPCAACAVLLTLEGDHADIADHNEKHDEKVGEGERGEARDPKPSCLL